MPKSTVKKTWNLLNKRQRRLLIKLPNLMPKSRSLSLKWNQLAQKTNIMFKSNHNNKKDSLYQLKLLRSHKVLIKFKSLLPWRRHWNKQQSKPTNRDWHLNNNRENPQLQVLLRRQLQLKQLQQLRVKHSKPLRNSKHPNKKHFLINWQRRKSKDKSKSSRMRSLKRRLLMPKRRDKTRKFSQKKEHLSLKYSKRRKLPKNLRLRRWNRNSCQLKLFRRPKQLLLRRPPPKPI